uniref:Uncharacterized protein n=1 Tax=Knipowitschia caucasica TaxID=637954 RepID=A0AAV2JEQ0_KNICA
MSRATTVNHTSPPPSPLSPSHDPPSPDVRAQRGARGELALYADAHTAAHSPPTPKQAKKSQAGLSQTISMRGLACVCRATSAAKWGLAERIKAGSRDVGRLQLPGVTDEGVCGFA